MPIAMDFNFKNYFLTLLIRSFKEALTDSGGQIMAKDKEIKTNAMRFLDKNKIKYEKFIYDCDEFIDGTDVARKLGQPFERTFKTLVTVGKSDNYFVFVLPVDKELDLKKAAKSVGEKSLSMIPVKDIINVTGYIRGGCTPVGMKKRYFTTVHKSAGDFETIFISGGKRGIQIEIKG